MLGNMNSILAQAAKDREARAAGKAFGWSPSGPTSATNSKSALQTAPAPATAKRTTIDLTTDDDDDVQIIGSPATKKPKTVTATATNTPPSPIGPIVRAPVYVSPRDPPSAPAPPAPAPRIGNASLFESRASQPWRCPHCRFQNSAEANYSCSLCNSIKQEVDTWIRSQTRLIESLWTQDVVQGCYGKVGKQYGNKGRVLNGKLEPLTAASVHGNSEHVAFNQEPIPLAGTTIAILRPGRAYPDIVSSRIPFKIYKTPAAASRAVIERIDFGGSRPFFVFRNFDGVGGIEIANQMEHVLGIDVLSANPLGIHCGALGSGASCEDKFQKVYPRGMGLDYSRGFKMGDFLTKPLDLVAAQYGMRDIVDKGTGKDHMQVQVLSYKPTVNYLQTSGDYHPHVDGNQTGWVAIASIGHGVDFAVDLSSRCHKYFHKGYCPATGVRSKGNMQLWKSQFCPTCRVINLRSGDLILFYGNPEGQCCHGVLGTRADQRGHPGLPRWAQKVRMSFQVRNMRKGDSPRDPAQAMAQILNETAEAV